MRGGGRCLEGVRDEGKVFDGACVMKEWYDTKDLYNFIAFVEL
jgi:hypothetical protein